MPALAQRSRITGRIDNSQRITLRGHIHPKALPDDDQGAVDGAMLLPRVTVALEPSAAQQAALQQLLAEQQDPRSPNYHQWLTPEQYADRFGATQEDVDKIVAWLRSQHLQVTSVARGRNAVTFSGTAAAVASAFHVELHHYLINGQLHFANATEPSIPAALGGIVSGIRGLNNFRLKPASRSRAILPGEAQPAFTSNATGNHYLAPMDVAAVYNLAPLYNSGLSGAGQKVVVVGQTQVRLADIQQFRSTFNISSSDPQVMLVPDSQDPGIVSGDLGEADLDLELSSAAAPGAAILYVYSSDVMVSVEYAIDQNLAPVISMSYGACEPAYQSSEVANQEALAQQANVQGITWLAASGDAGATDCAGDPSIRGFGGIASVDVPASLPEVTGVGGSEFNEAGAGYWNVTNDGNGASVEGYIPETAWNDTAASGTPTASGGGASIFFAKPAWQNGPGVPNDAARDVPDISLSASANHDGYLIYTSDGCGSGRSAATCRQVVGGTSVGPPTMAGVLALLNQSLVASGALPAPGLGNINPQLYSLARSSPAVFHDITTGDNLITTTCNFTRRCTPGTVGFHAGPGYDQVTGLGTMDAHALVTAWTASSPDNGGKTTGPVPVITAVANGASYNQQFAPGMLVAIFGSQLSPTTQTAGSLPLPSQLGGVSVTVNNVSAPMYYVSSGQLNVQIPYGVPGGGTAVLTVNNNGQTASVSIAVAVAAPGIFTGSQGAPAPNGSAARGATTTVYITGAGAVNPAVTDGATPAAGTPVSALPRPQQPVLATVGGVSAPVVFAGIAAGLVGVTQINYQVPADAPLGPQPLVVSVGGMASTAATLTVLP